MLQSICTISWVIYRKVQVKEKLLFKGQNISTCIYEDIVLILHACGTELPSRHTTNILSPDNADYGILTAWISLGKKSWDREEEREICLFSYFCTYMDGCFKQSYCLYLDESRSTKFWCRCSKIQNKWVKVVRFRLERRLEQRKWGRTANQRDKKPTNPTQPKTKHNKTQHNTTQHNTTQRKRDNKAYRWCTELFWGTYRQPCP